MTNGFHLNEVKLTIEFCTNVGMTLLVDLPDARAESEQDVCKQSLDAIPELTVAEVGAQRVENLRDLEALVMQFQVTGLSRGRNQ